ncbi:unnamed protein product [Symbiodinium natans]|uniref:Uncharacterized protein n=1 Tax=Symbiodinium natans TaxID=878477 RepID=A0A812NX45_9DINO|nr:unnamed protein product [Symbiodinium natans]
MKLPVLLAALVSLAHLARADENDVAIGASHSLRTEEKQKEALQYAKYEQFCANTQEAKEKTLQEPGHARLSSDIADVDDIDKWTADKEKATQERQDERVAYMKAHGEYLKAIQNVGKAYTTIKSQDMDKEQAKSFLQFPDLFGDEEGASSSEADALSAPSGARAAIQAFLAENSEVSVAAEGPGKAKGYEFGSDKILDLLKKLEGKFKKERGTLEKDEVDKKPLSQIRSWNSKPLRSSHKPL